MDYLSSGLEVISRDENEKGITTGGNYLCRLEGCTGLRLAVRWNDGKTTYPCTKGMYYNKHKKQWKII